MTERLHFHFSLSCIGEGNGIPLQCSCLENPRDGGACWAAVYGVAQSRTQLKRLSSSSSSMLLLQPKLFIVPFIFLVIKRGKTSFLFLCSNSISLFLIQPFEVWFIYNKLASTWSVQFNDFDRCELPWNYCHNQHTRKFNQPQRFLTLSDHRAVGRSSLDLPLGGNFLGRKLPIILHGKASGCPQSDSRYPIELSKMIKIKLYLHCPIRWPLAASDYWAHC